MKRTLAFAGRTGKELLRDPLTLVFGVGFPVALLLMIYLLKCSIPEMPADNFAMRDFAPGMAVFGLSFLTLFLGMLLAGDRQSSFLMRVFASPMKSTEYLAGYTLPLLPVAFCQSLICLLVAGTIGLELTWNLIPALLVLVVDSFLYISFGLLLGVLLNDKQVGGIASILVSLSAVLGDTWFNLSMMKGTFADVCNALPFAHAVDGAKEALAGNFSLVGPHLLWVLGYTVVLFVAATLLFRKKLRP